MGETPGALSRVDGRFGPETGDELGARRGAGSPEELGDVQLDGILGAREGQGDVFVRFSANENLEDLDLTARQGPAPRCLGRCNF